MRRLVGTGLVVAVALIAVPVTAGATSRHATAMTTRTVKKARISFQYPRTWVVAATTDKALAAQAKTYAHTNPNLAARLSRPGLSAFAFLAIDPVSSPGYGNSTVGVSFLPGVWDPHDGLAQFRSTMTDVAKANGATVFDVEAVKVSGTTAYRFHMTAPLKLPDGTTGAWREGWLQLGRGKDETIVSVAAPNDATGGALINGVLASARRT